MTDTYRITSRAFGFPEFLATLEQAMTRLDREAQLHRGVVLDLERWEHGPREWVHIDSRLK